MAATTGLARVFPDEIVMQFRVEVERAINAPLPAAEFAARFLAGYPEPARMLVSIYKPETLIEVVAAMPDSAQSPILRRDGRRWVEQLWQQLAAQSAPQPAVAQA